MYYYIYYKSEYYDVIQSTKKKEDDWKEIKSNFEEHLWKLNSLFKGFQNYFQISFFCFKNLFFYLKIFV